MLDEMVQLPGPPDRTAMPSQGNDILDNTLFVSIIFSEQSRVRREVIRNALCVDKVGGNSSALCDNICEFVLREYQDWDVSRHNNEAFGIAR